MSHFADEIWADLARGTLPPEEAGPIERHLDTRCVDCSRMFRTWKGLAELLSRESTYQPPRDVVARARDLFSPASEEAESPPTTRIAELFFDSNLSPAPAGLRSVARSTRQLSYKAGNYYVDLRIEEHPGTSTASLLGQLMRLPFDERVQLEGLSVILSSGDSSLASTKTNRLGEFQLEIQTERDHNIAVGIGDEFAVVVPLRSRRRYST